MSSLDAVIQLGLFHKLQCCLSEILLVKKKERNIDKEGRQTGRRWHILTPTIQPPSFKGCPNSKSTLEFGPLEDDFKYTIQIQNMV